MGNEDGFAQAIASEGTNKIINFKGGYFSFAFGNEIALVLDSKSGYFILNCDEELFNEVKKKVKTSNKKELIKFWKKKSKEYGVSNWSEDFSELR